MAYKGLLNYGLDDLASEVKKRWINTLLSFFNKCGKLTEKYNVMNAGNIEASGGEYPNQDGFGWTNGVLLAMLD
ncbi:Cytoplasmic trehalase [compost metagenome]